MIPPMLRRMFTLASITSIGLALAGAAWWARSFWVGDGWYVLWERPASAAGMAPGSTGSTGRREAVEVRVWSSRGTLEALVQEGTMVPPWSGKQFRHGSGPPRVLMFQSMRRTGLERLGFRWSHVGGPVFINGIMATPGTSTAIDLPDWAIVLGGLLLPAGWATRRMRRRRGGAGFELVGRKRAAGVPKVTTDGTVTRSSFYRTPT